MKNFDAEREALQEATREARTFVLGGEQFVAKLSVRPEVLTRWDEINEDTSLPDVLVITDATLLALIEDEDGSHDRYRAMREDDSISVGVGDLIEVGKWLVEVQTDRPTVPPSGSSTSASKNGTSSTDDSSSQDTPEGSELSTSASSAT